MKNKGTYLLGMTEIPDNHVVMMVKSQMNGFTNDDGVYIAPVSMEQAVDNIELIDEMLVTTKHYRLMNKRRGLKNQLMQVISAHLDHPFENLNCCRK